MLPQGALSGILKYQPICVTLANKGASLAFSQA